MRRSAVLQMSAPAHAHTAVQRTRVWVLVLVGVGAAKLAAEEGVEAQAGHHGGHDARHALCGRVGRQADRRRMAQSGGRTPTGSRRRWRRQRLMSVGGQGGGTHYRGVCGDGVHPVCVGQGGWQRLLVPRQVDAPLLPPPAAGWQQREGVT